MQNTPNEMLKAICGLTKKLSVALEQGNLDEIGAVLEERQTVIDKYNSSVDKKSLTKEQRKVVDDIINADKQAYSFADKLVVDKKKKLLLKKKMNVGLLEYSKNRYDVTSGQFVDKKR